jgi:hypothetical protein
MGPPLHMWSAEALDAHYVAAAAGYRQDFPWRLNISPTLDHSRGPAVCAANDHHDPGMEI